MRRPVFASVLLAALAMGGVVLPVLHDAAHVAERVEVEQAHSDHHHHQVEDDHGAEAQPYCPEAASIELVCALCQVHVGAALASAMTLEAEPPARRGPPEGARTQRVGGPISFARGPPAAIV